MLAALALGLTLLIGPDGGTLEPALRAAEKTLPVAPLIAELPRLWLVMHRRDDWPMAFYSSPGATVAGPAAALAAAGDGSRLLPGLRLPRLFLYAPYYRPGDDPGRAIAEMPIDVADYFFRALIDARLERALAADAEAAVYRARAGRVMAEVPAPQRLDAFREAVAAFAANALSVANEIARSHRRRRARGGDLCRLLDHPRTLFASWRERTFGDGGFPGLYRRSGGGGVAFTRRSLGHDDKAWAIRSVLGGAWTGDPRHDFAALCPQG